MDKILQLLINNKQKKKRKQHSIPLQIPGTTDYILSKQYNTLNNKTTTKVKKPNYNLSGQNS